MTSPLWLTSDTLRVSGAAVDPLMNALRRAWVSCVTHREALMAAEISSVAAGDPLPADCQLIEIHVSELRQLFNAIDPSPFRERDLDPDAEEFIVDWARERRRSVRRRR